MIVKPRFARALRCVAAIRSFSRDASKAMYEEKKSTEEEHTREDADEPVGSVPSSSARVAVDDQDDSHACQHERSSEKCGAPTVYGCGALSSVVRKDWMAERIGRKGG